MSPEQAQGFTGDKIDGRSDLYSVGALLYEALTGRQPFIAETPLQVLMAQVSTPPPHPSSYCADLSPTIHALLLRALEKEPAKRFATAQEMRAALQSALATLNAPSTAGARTGEVTLVSPATPATPDAAPTQSSPVVTLPWTPSPLPGTVPAARSPGAAEATQVVTPTRPWRAPATPAPPSPGLDKNSAPAASAAQPVSVPRVTPREPEEPRAPQRIQPRQSERSLLSSLSLSFGKLSVKVTLGVTLALGALLVAVMTPRQSSSPPGVASSTGPNGAPASPPNAVSAPKVEPVVTDPWKTPEGQQAATLIAGARKLAGKGDYKGAAKKLDAAEKVSSQPTVADAIRSERETLNKTASDAATQAKLARDNDSLNQIHALRQSKTEESLTQALALASSGISAKGPRSEEFRRLKPALERELSDVRAEAARQTLATEAKQFLAAENFGGARGKAKDLAATGGDSAALLASIHSAEQAKKSQLDSAFERLRTQKDAQGLSQLTAEYRKLDYEGGPFAAEARAQVNKDIPAAINALKSTGPVGSSGIPASRAASPEEEAAYREIFKTGETVRRVELGESFLRNYPQSQLIPAVNHRLTLDYAARRQEQKAFLTGEKALAAIPNNVVTLGMMCSMIPRLITLSDLQLVSGNDPERLNLSDPKLPVQMVKSQEYCRRGLQLLDRSSSPVSAGGGQSTPNWDPQRALMHSGLGQLLMHEKKYEPATRELETAINVSSSAAPIDVYMLGVAYENLKQYDESYAVFSRCAKASSALQSRCVQGRDRVDNLRPPPSLKRKP
jgi:hypothetical protein